MEVRVPIKARCLVVLLATAVCGPLAQAAGSIKVENALAQCVELQPGVRSTTAQAVLLQANVNVKKSIGECGCKSAIAQYTSKVEMDGYRSFLQSGAVALRESGPQTLTLTSSAQLLGDRGVVLSLGCAAPD